MVEEEDGYRHQGGSRLFFCPLLGFVVRSQSKSEIMQWKVPSLFKGLPSKPKILFPSSILGHVHKLIKT